MVKVEKEEHRVEQVDPSWKDLVLCVRNSNEGVIERYIPLCLYVRSEVHDLFAASDEHLCRAISEFGYGYYVMHLSDAKLHTIQNFGHVVENSQTLMWRLYVCYSESM